MSLTINIDKLDIENQINALIINQHFVNMI